MLFEDDVEHGEHPLTLVQNEGFSVRSVAVPGTGTWTAQTIGRTWLILPTSVNPMRSAPQHILTLYPLSRLALGSAKERSQSRGTYRQT